MTNVSLDKNFDNQVEQHCVIAALQDELDARDTEMYDAERNELEATGKPHTSSSTSSLLYAMFVAVVTTVAGYHAVPYAVAVATPNSRSAINGIDAAVRMTTQVHADVVPISVSSSPLPTHHR